MSNGMKFDAEGNLVIAEGADYGGRRLTKTQVFSRWVRLIRCQDASRPDATS
jgi:gluconolactonase